MTEVLLGLLVGMALTDTVILAHLWCRLLPSPAKRRLEETAQETVDEDAARKSREIAEGIERLMCYSAGGRSDVDWPGGDES